MNFNMTESEFESYCAMTAGTSTHPMKLGSQGWTLVTSPIFTGVVYFPSRFRREHRWRVNAMWVGNLPCFGIVDSDEKLIVFYDHDHCKEISKSMVTEEAQVATWLLSQLAMMAKTPRMNWPEMTKAVSEKIQPKKQRPSDEGWI